MDDEERGREGERIVYGGWKEYKFKKKDESETERTRENDRGGEKVQMRTEVSTFE